MSSGIAIVGAGIVGSSIAYNLASRGAKDVGVFERALPGEGSTAKATGGFRHQFGTRVNIELSKESIQVFEQFESIVGVPLQLKRVGYLFLTDDIDKAAQLRRNVDLQRSLGVDVSELGPDDITRRLPGLRVAESTMGTFCPDDGITSPTDVAAGYLSAAKRMGVEVHPRDEVRSILLQDRRVIGLETADGRVDCETVILSAGVWTPAVAATIGLDVPIRPHHRQVFMADGDAGLPKVTPFTVDLDTGAYFHREGAGLLLGGTDHGDDRGFVETLDWSLVPTLVEATISRVPAAEGVVIQSGWAGLREMTPDEHGLVGSVPGFSGLYIAAGFSGHGFMHSPAVGRIIADLVLDGRCDHPDIAALDPLRFASGATEVGDANRF
jgi:sarcosine oxidase subunit beta